MQPYEKCQKKEVSELNFGSFDRLAREKVQQDRENHMSLRQIKECRAKSLCPRIPKALGALLYCYTPILALAVEYRRALRWKLVAFKSCR